MSSQDMRDIAGFSKDDQAKARVVKVARPPMKRPSGMAREVFNLMVHGPNEETLMSSVPNKASIRDLVDKMVRKWTWKEFENQGRTDGFKMKHWEREDRNPNDPYVFARMNKHLNIAKPTQEEYDKLFQTEKWSFEATDYLFSLCERFDLRWNVIGGNFDVATYGNFSLEDMKERYYKVSNGLKRERQSEEQLFWFDADNERKRKEQLEILWNRTDEEIKEEEMLRAQMRRIDLKRKEREKKTQDLQRLINAVERSASPDPGPTSSNTQQSRDRRRPQKQPKTLMAAHLFSNDLNNLRFSEFRTAGPHLRSQEMKLPSNVGQKKLKAIEAAIEKYDLREITLTPPAHEDVVKMFNEFRSRVVLAQELRNVLHGTQ